MAEKFRFFDAVEDENGVYDREYNAQEFTDYFKALVTTGIMKGAGNQLAVTTNGSSMITSINTGIAFILGRYYENDSPLELTHDTETVGNNRIDRIVIRMDLSTEARYVKAFIKKGVPSTNPIAPNLTQTANLYEISLAQIKIVGGQTYIAVDDVRDERGTDVICPWAGSNILPNFNDEALAELVAQVEGLENQKARPNGIATLDSNGSVPMSQLKNVPLPQDASTTQKGVVQLNTALNSPSTTQAATPSAIKAVNDKLTGSNLSLGIGSSATLAGAVALGQVSSANSYFGIAIGYNARADKENSVAIGYGVSATMASDAKLGVGTNGYGPWNWLIPGQLYVSGTKNFQMAHPHPDKKATHVIRHGAVESPTTGDTLYRYTIEANEPNQVVEVLLPDYFEHLNINVDVWVNPHLHFGRAYGIVEGDKLKVTCETPGQYKALIIGTRNDDDVQDWYIKGVEREIGETWLGETYEFEVIEYTEIQEIKEEVQ
ncbi:tail fiber protein [Ureibacillus sinduriensis]|uniref:tail fiber protein n=1 Tax=Ureibacillus sinduriensis TaxID=561440 RepID=UPI00068A37D1|nr:tail fiber protein [Ureibacillus sinduriensis]